MDQRGWIVCIDEEEYTQIRAASIKARMDHTEREVREWLKERFPDGVRHRPRLVAQPLPNRGFLARWMQILFRRCV